MIDIFSWLDEEYLTESKEDWDKLFKFAATDPPEIGGHAVEVFKAHRNRLKGEERDLYYWIRNGNPEEFIWKMNELETTATLSQKKKADKIGATLVAENEGWRVYKIETHEAARLYGKGTKWCITMKNPEYWESYTEDGSFYFIIRKKHKGDQFDKIAVQIDNDYNSVEWFWDASDISYTKVDPSLDVPTEFDGISIVNYIKPVRIFNTFIYSSTGHHKYTNYDGTLTANSGDDDLYPEEIQITKLIINGDTKAIPAKRFANFETLREVIFEEGVEEIGERAFSDCGLLEVVSLPNTLTTIDTAAFRNCRRLHKITIPKSVHRIRAEAFKLCIELESVNFEPGIQLHGIDVDTFRNCNLKELNLPEGLQSILWDAFRENKNLKKVTIPASLNQDKCFLEDAFKGCNSITDVEVPSGLEWAREAILGK